MSKRTYKSVRLQDINIDRVVEMVRGQKVVVGIDVAKYKLFAVISTGRQRVDLTLRWDAPQETRVFVGLVLRLREACPELSVAMEPTGTYGDTLRSLLEGEGVPVFRVSPKRVHDAAEDFDGVPSTHDAKAAAIIAQQHWDEKSHRWETRSDSDRRLKALVEMAGECNASASALVVRLESKLARHFPELGELLELGSTSLLSLLSAFPSPALIAASSAEASALLHRVGRGRITPEKQAALLEAARTSTGQRMIAEEEELIRELCQEVLNLKIRRRAYVDRIAEHSQDCEEIVAMTPILGLMTAATLVVTLGSPTAYGHSAAYVKALGLNLKVHSSGEYRGQLHISRRGPGKLRALLFLAALRLLMRNQICRAWYDKKVARDGGTTKHKAVVALMRKLAAALWHVAKGEAFDASKLFDVRRLTLESTAAADEAMSPAALDVASTALHTTLAA